MGKLLLGVVVFAFLSGGFEPSVQAQSKRIDGRPVVTQPQAPQQVPAQTPAAQQSQPAPKPKGISQLKAEKRAAKIERREIRQKTVHLKRSKNLSDQIRAIGMRAQSENKFAAKKEELRAARKAARRPAKNR